MACKVIIISLIALLVRGAVPAGPQAVVRADASEQREMAEWALERYAIAGLDLPPLIIEFAGRNLAACGGAPARTDVTATSTLIRMCWNDRFVLLHELGHVWEVSNCPPENRASFMAMRSEVESWASGEVGWAQRGREHAANVIAWGVLEDPLPISRTYPNDPGALTVAFQFLTGSDPLHDGGVGVREPDRQFFSSDRANPRLESGR